MPIYGYTCTNCSHALDALQKISDAPLVDCPACDKPTLRRQLSAPRFRLKGEGWYETDFKTENQRNLAGDREASGSDAAASGDKSSADSTASDKTGDKAKPKSSSPAKTA